MKACIGFHKSFSYSSNICCEMDIIKFRDNAMVCGCTTKIPLIYGVIKLSYGIRMKSYKIMHVTY